MPGLIIWKDEELNKMKRDMDILMSRLQDDLDRCIFPPRALRKVPTFKISEDENSLSVSAELPEVAPEDLHVSVSENILNIKGIIRLSSLEREGEYFRRVECSSRSFSKNIHLPCRIKGEDTQAFFKDGTLYVLMPKCSPQKSLEIKIVLR